MSTRRGASDELSRTLLELRTKAGLSGAEAARRAGIGQASLSRYETGRFVPQPKTLEALVDVYGASATKRRQLAAIVNDLRQENRRVVVHRSGAPGFQRRIGDIEKSSAHIATFQPAVIPGILQTEAYMRVLTAPAGPKIAEGVVSARLERQKILGDPGKRWTQIMTAGALLWCAGSPAVMVEQLEHIIDVSHRDGVRIGVIPPRTPAEVFPMHGFDIYDERAVIVGTLTTTAVINEAADVRRHLDMLAAVEKLAVFGDDARAVLADIADEYRTELPDAAQ